MKLFFAGLAVAAFVASCAGHSTMGTNPTIANPGSAGPGVNPHVSQPGSPLPRWVLIDTKSIYHPGGPVLGADHNIWFAGEDTNRRPSVGRITPRGDQAHFPVAPKDAVITAMTLGPDGNVWFTVVKFHPKPVYIAVAKITPGGSITQYPLASKQTLDVRGIASGPDGELWITRQSQLGINDEVDKITTSGVETPYQLQPSRLPQGIVAGSDGAMWFAETSGNAIGRITTTGSVSEFPLPAGLIAPNLVVRSGDGNVWFNYVEQSTSVTSIAKIAPGGSITAYPNPQPETAIDGLTVGPDGALWFAESMGVRFHNSEQLRRITLAGVYDTEDRVIPLEPPFNAGGINLTTGADGNLWVTESFENRLAVYAWRKMTVVPSSVTLGVGQSVSIATSETHYTGGWTAASSNRSVATVTAGQSSGTFVIHGKAAGSCTVTISDSVGNSYLEPVTVQ